MKQFFSRESLSRFNYLLPFLALILSVYILWSSFSCDKKEIIDPSIDPKYKLNLESDMGRLECVFEHRRCLYENIGFDREGILKRCGEIDFCDAKYRAKK